MTPASTQVSSEPDAPASESTAAAGIRSVGTAGLVNENRRSPSAGRGDSWLDQSVRWSGDAWSSRPGSDQ